MFGLILATALLLFLMFFRNKLWWPQILNKFRFKVDKSSKLDGGQLVAEVLAAHKVPYIFTLVGGHISPILVACEKRNIKVIDTRHEVTTVFAADAVARLSPGSIGVAAVTAGPGVTNTITAVKNAQMAESPVLLLGGAAATLLAGRGSLQDIDQMSLLKPLCKYASRVTAVKDIVPTLKEAIHSALSDTPGPVFVELPIDTLYSYEAVMKNAMEDFAKMKHKSIFNKLAQQFSALSVENLFAGAFENTNYSPIPISCPTASEGDIKAAAELLANAERPVVLCGSQIMCSKSNHSEIVAAIERLQLPAFLGGMSRGLLGSNHNLQIRHNRRNILRDADCILLLGTVCDFRLNYGRVLPAKAKIISVNRCPQQLNKNRPLLWNYNIGSVSDAADFLIRLSNKSSVALKFNVAERKKWVEKLRESDEAKEKSNHQLAKNEEEKLNKRQSREVSSLSLLEKTRDVMGDKNAIIVADGGDFVGSAAYILRPTEPLGWLDPGAFGTLGCGAGFALGAKLIHPEKDVWIIYGDGAFGYSLIEFDTFHRFGLHVTALIGNDACWTQIAREQIPMFDSSVACNLQHSAYHDSVKALGCSGVLLDDANEMESVLQQAKKATRDGQTVVVNAIIGKSSFRDGSISL